MTEPQNLANAAIIIACIYFLFNYNSEFVVKLGIYILILFSIATWGIFHQTKENKKLMETEIQQREANIKNLNAATAIAVANTKLIMRKITGQ
ncbi:MAG TPA: hypothetical protein VMX17_06305 [Candidatus Glassbacteria bacterium]|nr:hypothetical protein [Candidatus Glassbacteria bacterium]